MALESFNKSHDLNEYWIFAYSSLLLSITDSSSDSGCPSQRSEAIPCRLHGWQRNWLAIRKEKPGSRKRFVDALSFDTAKEFAFASIDAKEGEHINGVAYRVNANGLSALDFREEGYHRTDVTAQIEPYEGYQLSGSVGVFVDVAQEFAIAPVSFEYANMGIWGAEKWDVKVPGFLREYCETSPLPPGALANMRFIYIGLDGRTVWLLHMQTEMKTLLALLPASIIPDSNIEPESTLDWLVPCPIEWQAYDYRYRFDDNIQRPVNSIFVLDNMVDAIWGDTPQKYLRNANWLVRLGCLSGSAVQEDWVQLLAEDPDDWVSRAARAVLANI